MMITAWTADFTRSLHEIPGASEAQWRSYDGIIGAAYLAGSIIVTCYIIFCCVQRRAMPVYTCGIVYVSA